MQFALTDLDLWLASVLWPLFRISALIMTLSVYGNRTVSARVRLLLALSVTVCVAPVLPRMPEIPLFSFASALITAQEVMIGIVLGFSSRILLEIFVVAGQLISLQTGLGFASLVDPVNGNSVPLVGQFFLLLATLLFFLMDGHLIFIELVVHSFRFLPVGVDSIAQIDFMAMAQWGRWLFSASLMIALAAVLALLMLNVAFGVLARAAPQMNLFVIGFPMTMLIGLFLLWLVLADFPAHFAVEFSRAQDFSCALMGLRCG